MSTAQIAPFSTASFKRARNNAEKSIGHLRPKRYFAYFLGTQLLDN